MDPATVAVIGVVGASSAFQIDSAPPEKKPKKEKVPSKSKKSVDTSTTDSKISVLDQKWSERFTGYMTQVGEECKRGLCDLQSSG